MGIIRTEKRQGLGILKTNNGGKISPLIFLKEILTLIEIM
jgi:hypothetical protein